MLIAMPVQDSKKIVNRASELQDERRRSGRKGPPLWAVIALVCFAWDDVWAYLSSPVALAVALVLLLICYQVRCKQVKVSRRFCVTSHQ